VVPRVALRASGSEAKAEFLTDSEWKLLRHTFLVEEMLAEVELTCELAGTPGEVWFDAASLRLVQE
jgi:hypothetical protein